MATQSLITAPPESPKPDTVQPKRFWQWALMFPAAIAPLYTAVPVWADKGRAIYSDIRGQSYKEGQEQLRLAYRNMDCLKAPYRYYTNPSRLKIDGTICKSGDVLVRAVDELQRQAIYFLPVATIQGRIDTASPQEAAPAAATFGVSSSGPEAGLYRAGLVTGFGGGIAPARVHLAQSQVTILSTRPTGDPRYIIQRIRRPDGCFDQVIDLANGAVIRVTPVPC